MWICRINGEQEAGGKGQERRHLPLLSVGVLFVLVGCASESVLPTVVPVAILPSPPPTPVLVTTETPPPTSTAVFKPTLISAETAVPPELVTAAQQIAADFPDQFEWADNLTDADIRLVINDGEPIADWFYAVAAPFPTVTDAVTLADLQSTWQQESDSFVLSTSELATANLFLGKGETAVFINTTFAIVETLWENQQAFTLMPFHQLEPQLKVIQVDGVSPLDRDFDQSTYPFVLTVGVKGEETAVSSFLAHWNGPATNRDPAKITRIAMTGVTALVRATAYQMELNGVLYPGTAVSPILNSADIAHISNEVSFSANCAYPDPFGGTSFCSRDSYFELLTDLGVDVIELTGNHLNDLGRENLTRSMEMYADAGMKTFGGGSNLAEAEAPLLITHNGNQIAFVGCNPVGPAYAWATVDLPGSRPCDAGIYEQISELNEAGYVVIATQQYHEFYHYAATAQQKLDFKALAEAGATAVSGSQGHHAQGFDFHNGAFIHYGLGNLFFDQMDQLGTRQTFVDTYVIYDNQLISVELWTGLIENYARPRDMTPQERVDALQVTFNASGWGE